MTQPPFAPEQFSSPTASSENELKKWLRSVAVGDRVEFIKCIWPINYILALRLVRSSQIPIVEIESLLRHWLSLGQHNAAQRLISSFEPLLGKERFWSVVSDVPLSESMREFINYHSHGRLNENTHG